MKGSHLRCTKYSITNMSQFFEPPEVKFERRHSCDVGMSRVSYRLELLVTNEGASFYPPIGTVENLSPDNAGYDLKIVVDQRSTLIATLVPLGVKARMLQSTVVDDGIEVVEDCHFTLEPRSSIYKTGFMMANGRGIIDRSYRGELKAPIVSTSPSAKMVEAGTRLFQVIAPGLGYIKEVAYVSSLPETVRGEGGFGSTGTK